tara:strand:- start:401 stop:580 length:180 start_codon:yes stop_codon:yes gene_type:complete
MKPGDLVVLSPRKTRKGLAYEEKIGLVLASDKRGIIKIKIDGQELLFNEGDLVLVNESG